MGRRYEREIGWVPREDQSRGNPARRGFLIGLGGFFAGGVSSYALDHLLNSREDPSIYWNRPLNRNPDETFVFTSNPTVYLVDFQAPPAGIALPDNFPIDPSRLRELSHETRIPLFPSPQVATDQTRRTANRSTMVNTRVQFQSGAPYEVWNPGKQTPVESGVRILEFDNFFGLFGLKFNENRGTVGVGIYGKFVDVSGKGIDELGADGNWFVPLPYFTLKPPKK